MVLILKKENSWDVSATKNTEVIEIHAFTLVTVIDFLFKLGIKPRMHLVEKSIMNRADKNWAHS
jgi:hypothetical protein